MENKTCCFIGHRPQSLPWGFDESDPRCILLKKMLRKEIKQIIREHGVTHFISGMALGVDTWAAEIILELKEKEACPITLECAFAYEDQAALWPEADRNRYFFIVERCDKENLLQAHCTPDCFRNRNSYMVNHSDYVIAVWDGTPSGTGRTVCCAREMSKKVIVLTPPEEKENLSYDLSFRRR